MNIREVDLNLLVILDALLQEAHVSRAARRVGLSQPAASSALDRCRRLFDDPLLLRSGGGMELTPRALHLREELKPLLAGIRAVLEVDSHPLSELRQTLRISMSDSLLPLVASPLIRHLAEIAPAVNLVFTTWFGPGRALDSLAGGEVDLAISQFPGAGASIHTQVISHEDYAVVMRRDHPAANGFDLDKWLQWPHVLVSGRGENFSAIDQVLAAVGRTRRVSVVVPNFVVVPSLLLDSDLLATLPSNSIAEHYRSRLLEFRPPVDLSRYALHLAWHTRSQSDPLVQHVAGFLAANFRAG
ncbi:LysR family transcriptional regulator [Haliea sp. E17]|uniref:LysR family transcriptional regulator n=1 Tax=Haliea sp. E17 TaxID=3401576 RepID=UPI003AAD7664